MSVYPGAQRFTAYPEVTFPAMYPLIPGVDDAVMHHPKPQNFSCLIPRP
jgi:hypothetical protein